MEEMRLGMVEARFADIVWQNEPMTTKELCAACESELNWKRTTTYTVIKRLGERGVLENKDTIVSSLVSKEEAQKNELDELMEKKFEGSLPAFIAAFARSQKLSDADIEEIRHILER